MPAVFCGALARAPVSWPKPLSTAAYFTVAALTVGLTITQDEAKPFTNPNGFGRPGHDGSGDGADDDSDHPGGTALAAYDRLVPAHACVGAALGPNEPSYVLFNPRFNTTCSISQTTTQYRPPIKTASSMSSSAPRNTRAARRHLQGGGGFNPSEASRLLASEPRTTRSAADACATSCNRPPAVSRPSGWLERVRDLRAVITWVAWHLEGAARRERQDDSDGRAGDRDPDDVERTVAHEDAALQEQLLDHGRTVLDRNGADREGRVAGWGVAAVAQPADVDHEIAVLAGLEIGVVDQPGTQVSS